MSRKGPRMCTPEGSAHPHPPRLLVFPLAVASTAGFCLERSVTTHVAWEDTIACFQFLPPTFYWQSQIFRNLTELWTPIYPQPKFYHCYYFSILTLSWFIHLCIHPLGVWFDSKEIFHKFKRFKKKIILPKKGLSQKRDNNEVLSE